MSALLSSVRFTRANSGIPFAGWIACRGFSRTRYRKEDLEDKWKQSCRDAMFQSPIDHSNPFVTVSEEIREAVISSKPLVALESAIYTHGFPYPENIALASHLESVVRANGGIPATVGVLNGVARVGFEPEELIELASSVGRLETRKVSRRDISYICGMGIAGRRLNGGTTISATMLLATRAGIRIFATGGLGGVHRNGENSLDISADLTELGRTPMAVISSGCKSFLDLPRTLEYLETQGVCVGTFADDRGGEVDFPAFWTRDSGVKSPLTITDENEAAAMIHAMLDVPVLSGLLLANPVPTEYSIAKPEMDAIIREAVKDADNAGAKGSANTPFVLNRIREISKGGSVSANRALVEANVLRGTKVAVLHSKQRSALQQSYQNYNVHDRTSPNGIYLPMRLDCQSAKPSLDFRGNARAEGDTISAIVAGSLAVDLSCDYLTQGNAASDGQPQFHTSNLSSITQSIGGVGHNVASTLHHMGATVRLCTSVANDVAGSSALAALEKRGLSTAGVKVVDGGSRTAQYVAVNDARKSLVLAMADMNILERNNDNFEKSWMHHFGACRPKWLVVDANWDPSTLRKWLHSGKASGAKVALEPVSIAKSKRIFAGASADDLSLGVIPNNTISLATPNALELGAMHQAASSAGLLEREDWFRVIDSFGLSSSGSRPKLVSLTKSSLVDQGVPQQSIQLLPFIPCILTTLGENGVLMTQVLRPGDDRLNSPESAPYILTRSTDGNAAVGGIYMRLFAPIEKVPTQDIVSVNGVGDTFLGVIVAGLTKDDPKDLDDLVDIAQKASILTLKSVEAVSPAISTLKDSL